MRYYGQTELKIKVASGTGALLVGAIAPIALPPIVAYSIPSEINSWRIAYPLERELFFNGIRLIPDLSKL